MMTGIWGGTLVVLSAVLLYLAAPHQRWGTLRPFSRMLGRSGVLLLVAGMALLLSWAGIATAFFIAATLLMATWSIVPVTIAWLRRKKGERA